MRKSLLQLLIEEEKALSEYKYAKEDFEYFLKIGAAEFIITERKEKMENARKRLNETGNRIESRLRFLKKENKDISFSRFREKA